MKTLQSKTRLKWKREQGFDYSDYWTVLRVDKYVFFDLTIELSRVSSSRTRVYRVIWITDTDRPIFEDSKTHSGTLDDFERELRGLEWNLLGELNGYLSRVQNKVHELMYPRNAERP